MKRTIKLLSIALLGLALSCPSIEARGRNNGNGGNSAHNTTQGTRNNTPAGRGNSNTGRGNSNTSRPTQSQGSRPSNSSRPNNSNNNGNRPGNNGNTNTNRPNNGNNNGNRPGNNGNGQNFNPGNGGIPGQNFNPGNGGGPGTNNGNRPGHDFGYGPSQRPNHGYVPGPVPNYAPNRPMLPQTNPFRRPTPPPSFRPGPRYPIVNTILGVAIGTAINATINYLLNDGYYVTGYTNNAVYLNDVMQLNMLWLNATLYYNSGCLMGSEFIYSTPYYDPNRYYSVYNELTRAYGMPITRQNIGGGGMECTWFGYDGQYVTLQFLSGLAANGMTRYYTTLSFGI